MIILGQVQINIILSILLSILLGHAYFNINRKKITNGLFIWIMGLTWIVLLLEIFSVTLNSKKLSQFILVHKFVDKSGFILTPIIPFLGYMFVREWVNRYQKDKIKFNSIFIVPLFINGIGVLISHDSRGIFYINMNNIYERGALFFILPCVCYMYFVFTLYFICKHRRRLTNSEYIMFSSVFILPAIFTVIQLAHSAYLTTWNCTAIIIVISYIFILNDQSYRDSLTGLENRLSFEQYSENISQRKLKKLVIIYIDIDGFKTINDQYGHSIGDEAIQIFASLLVESFPTKHKRLVRLGGDEFLVLLENHQQETAIEYIENLTEKIRIFNKVGEKNYKFSFSYGIVSNKNQNDNIDKLMDYADQLMYEHKQSRKII